MEGMGDETRVEVEDEVVEVGRGAEVQGSVEVEDGGQRHRGLGPFERLAPNSRAIAREKVVLA
ncbi:hypothetical protein E2C01_025417 [Portunus trituberculatus]|uniref:Uncharacterized protein n=1 Tax=Portunus trituberculatus TaxID=210409 RepID=A0A5B7EGD9_PORTR|nr:hypothetical protein [Portunus trituberculatus]